MDRRLEVEKLARIKSDMWQFRPRLIRVLTTWCDVCGHNRPFSRHRHLIEVPRAKSRWHVRLLLSWTRQRGPSWHLTLPYLAHYLTFPDTLPYLTWHIALPSLTPYRHLIWDHVFAIWDCEFGVAGVFCIWDNVFAIWDREFWFGWCMLCSGSYICYLRSQIWYGWCILYFIWCIW